MGKQEHLWWDCYMKYSRHKTRGARKTREHMSQRAYRAWGTRDTRTRKRSNTRGMKTCGPRGTWRTRAHRTWCKWGTKAPNMRTQGFHVYIKIGNNLCAGMLRPFRFRLDVLFLVNSFLIYSRFLPFIAEKLQALVILNF